MKENFPEKRPLLAHYCGTATLESIVRHEELWFSNPLYMNDYEELGFGLTHGMRVFRANTSIRDALATADRYERLRNSIETTFAAFDAGHILNFYAACFSEHAHDNDDGLLSMWRGYGENGAGAAVVFDTGKLQPRADSPLIVSKVTYGTAAQRIEHIEKILYAAADSLANIRFEDSELELAGNMLFERLLTFALFTKHVGFHEEKECRVVYFPHRDQQQKLTGMLGYHVGPNGVQPKLKFKIAPIDEVAGETVSLKNLVHKIILGPTGGSALKQHAIVRMMQHLGKPELAEKVVSSSTPFRPT